MYEELIIRAVVGIIVAILVFLILRELFCWYWKINARIALMKEQNQLLRLIATKLGVSNANEILAETSGTVQTETVSNEQLIKELYDWVEELNVDSIQGRILTISKFPRNKIEEMLGLYKSNYGKSLYAHLMEKSQNEKRVNVLLEPLTNIVGEIN